MKREDINPEEEYIKQVLKDVPLEELPDNFTKQVMGRIQHEAIAQMSVRYSPLISWRSALYIAFLFALFVTLIWWGSFELPALNNLLMEYLPISNDILPSISDKIFTRTMIYALIVLIGGIGLQFYHVKRWHNRQFAAH